MLALPKDFGTNVILKATEGLRLHLDGKSEGVRVVLKPETLGELTIRARMEEGKVFAEIRVQQTEVKAVLEAQVPQLRDTLVSQGIDVQRVEIVSDGGEMHFHNSDEGRASHQRPARFRRGHKNVDAVEELDAVRSLGYNTIEYII
jgi:flagellar hook-length control protein FliK